MTAARAHAIFGKCMIQAPHEPESLGLIASIDYVAIVVGYIINICYQLGYGVAAVFTPQHGRFLRFGWSHQRNSNRWHAFVQPCGFVVPLLPCCF